MYSFNLCSDNKSIHKYNSADAPNQAHLQATQSRHTKANLAKDPLAYILHLKKTRACQPFQRRNILSCTSSDVSVFQIKRSVSFQKQKCAQTKLTFERIFRFDTEGKGKPIDII